LSIFIQNLNTATDTGNSNSFNFEGSYLLSQKPNYSFRNAKEKIFSEPDPTRL